MRQHAGSRLLRVTSHLVTWLTLQGAQLHQVLGQTTADMVFAPIPQPQLQQTAASAQQLVRAPHQSDRAVRVVWFACMALFVPGVRPVYDRNNFSFGYSLFESRS